MQRSSIIAVLIASFLVCVFGAREVYAQGVSVRLNAETIQRGYTVTDASDVARLAVWPGLVADPVSIRLEPSGVLPQPYPADAVPVSDAWTFDVLKTNITEKDPLALARPLTIALKHNSANLHRKRLYFWDANKSLWQPLPSSTDANGYVRGMIRLPYAVVAVFDDQKSVEGKASWFRHRYDDTAASNDFPYGSTLKVTNMQNGKSVNVVVRSTGPFVQGRVVDIAHTAFQKIEATWRGIAVVRVTLLSS